MRCGRPQPTQATPYRNAIHRACDKAFPPHGALAKRDDEGGSIESQETSKAAETPWPNQLRKAAILAILLEGPQVVLGHANDEISQIHAELDTSKAEQILRDFG